MSARYETIALNLRPLTLVRLLPELEKLASAEWEDDEVKCELENLVCEFTARLQRAERGE